ncbi:MAG TPA: hypothetical protein VL974_08040 [Magnetospirillum sp.]|nr:hypothetical protein [Magnetospirillum sp.]
MIRMLTAAALAALLATPVMAQNVSPSDNPNSVQNQGSSSPSGPMSGNSGLSNQIPADCTPSDPRPACQTAQLPGSPESGTSKSTTSPSSRSGSSTWESPQSGSQSGSPSGTYNAPSGSSSGSSGSMGR